MVLAPGFRLVDRTAEAGKGPTTMSFDLSAQPWKETQLRLEDAAGKPVERVEVTGFVGSVVWSRVRTDAEGRCRIAMAPGMPLELSAKPEGSRPIMSYLGVTEDEPASVTLPVLPPIRGRVLDSAGQPVPDLAVGWFITFWAGGKGQMQPLPGADRASTDREGRFTVTPRVYAGSARDLTQSKRSMVLQLCFADPTFERIAYHTIDPSAAIEPMEVRIGPTRRVHIPIAWGSVATTPTANLTSTITIEPRRDMPDGRVPLISRDLTRKAPAAGPTEEDVVEESLPEATYRLDVRLAIPFAPESLGQASREFVVPPGVGRLDLPPLELQPSASLKMIAKPAPKIEAADLDTGRPVKLADFRGKVVILDFWGYWCGVCNVNMPQLIK